MKQITVLFCALLFCMALSAQNSFDLLKLPEGENLLINPCFVENPDKPGQLLKWGGRKDIRFSWIEENGRKILRAETTTPGYHLGVAQTLRNLKPNTEYVLYLAARGKIADGSVRILYHDGKLPGQKKAAFGGIRAGMKQDFPWTLFQKKFRTPADFKNGTFTVYPVLFTGSVQIDMAFVGLIEHRLPKVPDGAQNLLVNPELKTSSLTPRFPYDWNMEFAEKKESYRYEQDKDGCGIVTLLPFVKKSKVDKFNDEMVALVQRYLTLKPGKKYRIGALIRTRNFKAPRSGLIVTNFGWKQAVGINSLPENTDGWKRIEADVILPKSRFKQYFFYVYTVGCKEGEVQIKSPYLIPMDADAAEGVEKAPAIHTTRRITPVAPLLCQMSAEKPQMAFSFRSILPKAETDYECRVRIKSADGEQVLAQGVFPLKENRIHAAFKKLAPGKILLEAELVGKQTGKAFASERYPAELRTLKLTRPPEKRLNMLTQRLLTADAKDGRYVFSAPRNGWVFISLSAGKNHTAVKLDGNAEPVIRAVSGRPFETLRHVSPGDHSLELANTNGGKLIVNSVPEILINGYPRRERITNEGLHRDYLENYYFPNVTTIAHGYPLKAKELKDIFGRGKELLNQTMHIEYREAYNRFYETPEELAKRFRVKPVGQGRTFDEIFIDETRALRIMTQALERLTDCPAPMYFWSSGVKFHINGLTAAYLSAIANHAKGKGKFIFECYARTQDSEEKADIYLEDYLNESIRRAKQLMPDAEKYSLMVLGMYTNAGNYCTDTYAGPDVKVFWNKVFYKWANEKVFKDLAGVGLYSWHQGNEESLRWAAKLIRHYVIEGNTEDLAAKYGYRYLPGHLKNGDFKEGLSHWTASGTVKAVTVKNLGRQFQKRMGYPFSIGDTACLFTRSVKAPNTLTAKITGLTPGKQYVLRYLLVDHADVKAKKPSGKKILLRAKLDGAQDITASSPVAKYLAPDGVNIRGYVNNVAVVFKAEKPEVDLTFSDWAEDTAPGAPAGQEILLNKVSVTPYFTETEY